MAGNHASFWRRDVNYIEIGFDSDIYTPYQPTVAGNGFSSTAPFVEERPGSLVADASYTLYDFAGVSEIGVKRLTALGYLSIRRSIYAFGFAARCVASVTSV